MASLRVSAALITDPQGRFLLARKAGTASYLFPGGKPEIGETPATTLIRELSEELGLTVTLDDLDFLGTFTSTAANEPNTTLIADCFRLSPAALADIPLNSLTPHAEIDSLIWRAPSDLHHPDIAPLTREVGPLAAGRGFLLYTGASMGSDPIYADVVAQLVTEIGRRGDHIIYGGGHSGLMGVIGDTAAANNTWISGVITYDLAGITPHWPTFYAGGYNYALTVPDGIHHVLHKVEKAHPGLNSLALVHSMSARKDRMTALSDVAVALPGGCGTMDEFFDTWVQLQLGIHRHPVALLNIDGCWDTLLTFLHDLVTRGFIKQEYVDALIVANSVDELYTALNTWTPPHRKWS